MIAQDVLKFWFEQSSPQQWFKKDVIFDAVIADRFLDIHSQASGGGLAPWRAAIQGRLAEIIVLDQFSRNLYRDDPRSFSSDGMALVLTQEALKQPDLMELTQIERSFLYMPLMHSESLEIHNEALKRFSEPGLEDNLDFEHRHRDILARFGRYPHRNEILERISTPEETEFLSQPGSSF